MGLYSKRSHTEGRSAQISGLGTKNYSDSGMCDLTIPNSRVSWVLGPEGWMFSFGAHRSRSRIRLLRQVRSSFRSFSKYFGSRLLWHPWNPSRNRPPISCLNDTYFGLFGSKEIVARPVQELCFPWVCWTLRAASRSGLGATLVSLKLKAIPFRMQGWRSWAAGGTVLRKLFVKFVCLRSSVLTAAGSLFNKIV